MRYIFGKILTDPDIIDDPPVLIDIGASEKIHPIWKEIAPHSICVAFDADTRDFNISSAEDKGYKKLYKLNTIVSDKEESKVDFYLTNSPYCSSTLPPREIELSDWAFADKFKVTGKTKLNSITLTRALDELGLNKIDWYKSDSQGTDLRLFRSLKDDIQKNVIVAELEPGIIDSYAGEDKMYEILKYMESLEFWLSDMVVKGSKRIKPEYVDKISSGGISRKLTEFSLKTSPGWAELCFVNKFKDIKSRRSFLLGWLFSSILGQHGFALGLAVQGENIFNEPLFTDLKNNSLKIIRKERFSLRALGLYLKAFKQKYNG
ncbi:MAG: hypothetical protein HUU54_03715 [Ignavibacteriaceae bacterium]|nr:hypothetical protein [Ignavibacteriaceae bacterium]